jgi:glucose/mannose transport system permease protein
VTEIPVSPGRKLKGLQDVAAVLLLTGLALFFLAPLYVMIATSLKSLDTIRATGIAAWPAAPGLEAWSRAWGTACIGTTCDGLKGYFLNSVLMAVPAVGLSVLIGAVNGYALTKWRFRGAELLFGLLIVGCFIPFQVILLPMARMLAALGLFGTIPGLVLVHVVYGLPVTTLLFRNYYLAVPDEILRAARIDGAGFFGIFRHVVLPLSAPMLAVAAILQFTGIWNDFLFGAVFAGSANAPLTVALNNLVGTTLGVKEYNVDMAATMMTALPTLAVYALSGRYFLRGLTAGAIKG